MLYVNKGVKMNKIILKTSAFIKNETLKFVFLALFIMFVLACASTPKLENYKRVSFSEFQTIFNDVATTEKRPKQGVGFIVEGYLLKDLKDETSYHCFFCETPNSNNGIVLDLSGTGHNNRKYYLNVYGNGDCKQYHFHRQAPNYYVGEENYARNYDGNDLKKKIDTTKKYTIYIGFYYHSYHKFWEACIDKIEGLRTSYEIAAIEAQKKAEQEAETEAKRKAIEEGYKNPVFTGTVASFVREYKENEYSFKAKYEDKIVQLTGIITSFEKGYESFFGVSTGRAIYQIKIEGGYCFQFNQSDLPEEDFLRLKKGQTITVVGKVPKGGGGYFGYMNGMLDNCRLKK